MISKEEQKILEQLIRDAGTRLLQYWPGSSPKNRADTLSITQKQDGSFVTKADFESNEILISGLKKLFPNDGIFSEELARDENLSQANRAWIIDPLDGTQSFIDGNDDFSILLGLCVGEKIVFGMMYFPARGLFARGFSTGGATLNGLLMKVSAVDSFRERAIYLRHIKLPEQAYFYDKWMDSGMAFLNLCRGELDGIILKLVHHQEWDLAAPAVMIEESGGVISDEFGAPIRFKRSPVTTGYFVASNGKIHQRLLDLIPQ